MKGGDRKELNDATIVSYALVRALFDELDDAGKRRVAAKALTHLPPEPDGSLPVDRRMWKDAEAELRDVASSARKASVSTSLNCDPVVPTENQVGGRDQVNCAAVVKAVCNLAQERGNVATMSDTRFRLGGPAFCRLASARKDADSTNDHPSEIR